MNDALLTAENLGFRYAGTRVLHDVNARVEAASMLAVTGPNGSGKSTLLHLLAGIEHPSAGRIHRTAATRVALLPQRTSDIDALPLTVLECVRIGRFAGGRLLRRLTRQDHAEVINIMERLEIAHLARRRLRELSGGQRQRTLLAQALLQEADVYILDEPTAALDPHARHRVHDLFSAKVRAGAGVVIASHDAGETARADRTLSLDGSGPRRRGQEPSSADHAPRRRGDDGGVNAAGS